jgi:hypothetical protein
MALVAVTLNVYDVPFVSPGTTTVLAPVVVALAPPGVAVTVYPVTAEPPLDDGALHDTDACVSPAVATTFVGAPGTTAAAVGVTVLDAAEAGPVPMAFVAVTLNVYDVPFTKPGTTTVVAPVVVALAPPGVAVTV